MRLIGGSGDTASGIKKKSTEKGKLMQEENESLKPLVEKYRQSLKDIRTVALMANNYQKLAEMIAQMTEEALKSE